MFDLTQEIRNSDNVLDYLLLTEISMESANSLVNKAIDSTNLRVKDTKPILCCRLLFLRKWGWSFNSIHAKDHRVFESDFYIMFYRYTKYWLGESIWYEDSILLANKTMYKLSTTLTDEVVKGNSCSKKFIIDSIKAVMRETLRDDYLKFKDNSGRISISDSYIEDIYHLLEIFRLTDKVTAYLFSFCRKKQSYAKNISDITDDLNRYITKFGDKTNVSSKELCCILSISTTTLSTWINNGIVTTFNKKGNAYFYRLSDILKDIKRG